MAELCLILPVTVLIVAGILQLLIAGYGMGFARFAAFSAMRAAQVAGPLDRRSAACSAAAAALAGVPGLGFSWVSVKEIPLPAYPGAAGGQRLSCRVRVKIPRLAPFIGLGFVEGGCAMLMEKSR